jgi:hypothetical protein
MVDLSLLEWMIGMVENRALCLKRHALPTTQGSAFGPPISWSRQGEGAGCNSPQPVRACQQTGSTTSCPITRSPERAGRAQAEAKIAFDLQYSGVEFGQRMFGELRISDRKGASERRFGYPFTVMR